MIGFFLLAMILETANTILVVNVAKPSFRIDRRLDKHSKMEYNADMTNERLARQIACIGEAKQKALSDATVVIVGLGGIGSVVAPMLAKMGVGNLILVDKATVKTNNLSRQMYTENDIGAHKVLIAKEKLLKINPFCEVEEFPYEFSWLIKTCRIIMTKADLILDCTDNADVRWEIEDFCKEYNIPWIYASVIGYIGRVKTFMPKSKVRLEKILPRPKKSEKDISIDGFNYISIKSPHEIGTIIPSVELVGTIQVSEALKIIWLECGDAEYMYSISAYPDVKVEKIELS